MSNHRPSIVGVRTPLDSEWFECLTIRVGTLHNGECQLECSTIDRLLIDRWS